MSATTVNAFPPLHAFNSSRPWFLAFIVLLHLGFFWALTHGVTIWEIEKKPPPFIVVDLPIPIVDPQPVVPPEPNDIRSGRVDPVPLPQELDHRETVEERAPQVDRRVDPVPPQQLTPAAGSGPVIVVPRSDPRYPFTEPEYPVSEIRLGHEGTVVLRVQILANGHVGTVQIERSSGFVKLDESAAREARRWRMKPGTQDGAASAMWTLVPVTFQLKN